MNYWQLVEFLSLEINYSSSDSCQQTECPRTGNRLSASGDVQFAEYFIELYQRQTREKVLRDIDNVRAAFRWAVKGHKLHELEKFLHTLIPFLDIQDWYQEGIETLRLAVDSLPETPEDRDEQQTRLLGLSLGWKSWFLRSLLHNDEARRLAAEESLALLLPFGDGIEICYTYQFLTQLSYDNLLEMKGYAQAALKCAQAIDYPCGLVGSSQLLSWALAELGEYDEARGLLDESLAISRKYHVPTGEMWTFFHLSHVAYCQQNWSEAKGWTQQALVLAESSGFQSAMAVHHRGLGDIAYQSGSYDEAKLHFQESLKLAQELGDQTGINMALESINRVEAHQAGQAASIPSEANADVHPLTERELEVLRLVADGLSNREIAEQQVLAISTVKWYINEIFSKLHVTTRTQAVARARTLGLLA